MMTILSRPVEFIVINLLYVMVYEYVFFENIYENRKIYRDIEILSIKFVP